MREPWAVILLVFAAATGGACGRASLPPPSAARPFLPPAALAPADARMAALLARSCASCHGDLSPAAGLRYDSLAAARQGARAAALQLAAHTMPPPTVLPPTDDDRRAMLAWLMAAQGARPVVGVGRAVRRSP